VVRGERIASHLDVLLAVTREGRPLAGVLAQEVERRTLTDRRPLRGVLPFVLEHHPDRAFAGFIRFPYRGFGQSDLLKSAYEIG
jgi:hypothetical protein